MLFVPYYNCFDIALGTAINQRVSTTINIESIEISINIRPDPANYFQNQ